MFHGWLARCASHPSDVLCFIIIFIASGGFRAPPKIVKKNPFGKEYEQLIIPIVEDNIYASSMIYLILIR